MWHDFQCLKLLNNFLSSIFKIYLLIYSIVNWDFFKEIDLSIIMYFLRTK